MGDRFGIGWRNELSAGILTNLDRIDVLEVMADDYFKAPSKRIDAMRGLARQRPVVLHSLGLGMGSTVTVDDRRLGDVARLIDRIQPESWSDHIAFVRGGGIEIGHLASPPRNAALLDSTLANAYRATRLTGMAPAMENVASFLDPPCSTFSEAEFLRRCADNLEGGLLLDLHNVHTNAINFGYDSIALIEALPLDRVTTIHIAGGRWMGRRMLDDHMHDVPDPIFQLLNAVAARTERPLTVILERDGAYPEMSALLAQLDRAREAVRRGREVRAA